MIRRINPFLCASALGLLAVHCGGSSTPESTTPAQTTTIEPAPDEPGSTAPMGSTSPMGTTEGSTGESTQSERMPMAGTDEPGMGDDITSPGATAALSDAQIAGITDAVHSSEIEQAQMAQSRSKDPHVLNLASMMLNHHTQARQREQAMGMSTAASPMLQTMSSQSRQTLATLKDKSGKDFDRAYIQAQIEQHQKALDTVDRQLLPNAKNPQLRSHLQSMRPTLQQHLEAAREAQQAMSTSGSSSDRPHPTGSPR